MLIGDSIVMLVGLPALAILMGEIRLSKFFNSAI